MLKFISSTLFALTAAFPLTVSAQSVKVKGSDTLLPLAQRWAQVYEKKNPQLHLILSGGGSGSGITALLKGETEIAESSRPLTDSEREEFRKLGKTPVDVVVAADAVTILVNPSNSVSSLELCLWAISPEAQAAAEKLGFIPISADVRVTVASRL